MVRELECLLVVRELLGRYEEEEREGKGGGKGVEDGERRDAHRCLDHLRQAVADP